MMLLLVSGDEQKINRSNMITEDGHLAYDTSQLCYRGAMFHNIDPTVYLRD